jgi:hypothetical protein
MLSVLHEPLKRLSLHDRSPAALLPRSPSFLFRHTPPPHLAAHRRWPSSTDAGLDLPRTLQLVWGLVDNLLDHQSAGRLCRTATAFHYGPRFSDLPLYLPWQPFRRRKWGFGIPTAVRSTHSNPTPYHSLIHFIWASLPHADRHTMSLVAPAWSVYPSMRLHALRAPIGTLRHRRLPPGQPTRLCPARAGLYAAALLRFNFVYSDFLRWLSGEYTNRHRNWSRDFQTMHAACVLPPPSDQPPPDFARGFRICTEGVPLKGTYEAPSPAIDRRNAYDNHPAVASNIPAVEKKFAKEEERSFHIHFPRIFIYFILGLFLNPLQWVFKKGKGRICVDCTHGPEGPDTLASINTFIPKPSHDTADECPPVYYATALMRYLRLLWRLRGTHPGARILQHYDDLESAFRRILYHPDMAVAFASVFTSYLMIPVGQVFGSRSSSSYFSLLNDIRA